MLNDGSDQYSSIITGSQPTIRNCFMTENMNGCSDGGGAKASGATYIDCQFSSNYGTGMECSAYGGKICTPTFLRCQFNRNVEEFYGGGLSVIASGVGSNTGVSGICSPTLINCIIDGNKAGQGTNGAGGAAIVCGVNDKGLVTIKLIGTLIVRNLAVGTNVGGGSGGAIYSSAYRDGKINLVLMNCTVADNYAGKEGNFLYHYSDEKSKNVFVTIKNSIILPRFRSGTIDYASSFPASVAYSILSKDSKLTGNTNIYIESGRDPFVVNDILKPERNLYRIYYNQPPVNAGDPNTNPKDLPATDLDGNPRFQGRIDIGAYERDVLPNRPPVALTHPDETATAGIPMLSGGQEAFFVDPEDKPLTLTAAGLPASLSLIRNSAGSYAISGTPKTAGVSSVTLIAEDPEGLADTLTFQLVVDTAPVAFQLTAPVYDCQTGAFTFKTTGGDGSLIEYQAAGITGWTSNPNQYVDQGLRTANDVQPFALMARQKGVVVSYSWNLKAACGRARLAASEATDRLLVSVLGNPVTGETAQVAISGADGQPLTLSLADAAGNVVSAERIEQATTETRTIRLGQSAGVYLLRASTPTQSWTVRVVKQ